MSLRYFALNTQKVMQAPKGNISLKKLLNEFMGSTKNNEEESIKKLKKDFETTIAFIREHFGEDAFHNIIGGDPSKIRKRFYPTIFDSLMVGTSIAIKKLGKKIPKDNLSEKRLKMLQIPDYRKFISEGTMQAESIQGRIKYVLQVIYGIQNK